MNHTTMPMPKEQRSASETIEQAEVILNNLCELGKATDDRFAVNHDDVLVTLKTAIRLLQDAQDKLI